jgi:spermidine synthase
LIFLKSIPKGMYIAGFSGSAIEILLFFSFQIIYGYVYSAIGLIIAVFMGGLAFGSLLGYRFRITPKHFIFSQFALSAYALIFPLLWYFQSEISHSTPILIVFFAMTFLPSVIVGFQYVAGITILQQDVTRAATSLYSADLIGSALGVVITTVLLLPLLGLMWCCFVIAGFNFVGALLTLSTHGKIFRK